METKEDSIKYILISTFALLESIQLWICLKLQKDTMEAEVRIKRVGMILPEKNMFG